MLPLFYESSPNPRIMKHGMELVFQIVHFLNPEQIPVFVADQPLYTIAKKIQWTHPEEFGEHKFVVMMGGFHIEMTLWKTMSGLLRDCRWCEVVAAAGIATAGTAASFLTASDPMKMRYAHQVTLATLDKLLLDAYKSAETNGTLGQWISETAEKNPTFAFWILVKKYEQLILIFV
jgi:hypothetical protein